MWSTCQRVVLIVGSNNYDDTAFIIYQWFCMWPECVNVSLRQLHTCEWNVNTAENSASLKSVKDRLV